MESSMFDELPVDSIPEESVAVYIPGVNDTVLVLSETASPGRWSCEGANTLRRRLRIFTCTDPDAIDSPSTMYGTSPPSCGVSLNSVTRTDDTHLWSTSVLCCGHKYVRWKGSMIERERGGGGEGRRGITVNAVAPGFIKTDMTEGFNEKDFKQLIPMARFGTSEEVAEAVG